MQCTKKTVPTFQIKHSDITRQYHKVMRDSTTHIDIVSMTLTWLCSVLICLICTMALPVWEEQAERWKPRRIGINLAGPVRQIGEIEQQWRRKYGRTRKCQSAQQGHTHMWELI